MFSYNLIRRISLEARYPTNLPMRGQDCCLQEVKHGWARSRQCSTGWGAGAQFPKRGCKQLRDSRKGQAGVGWGGRRDKADRSQESTMHHEKTYSQRWPSTCPFCPNFLRESWEMGWQARRSVSAPGSYLTHFSRGGWGVRGVLLSQGTVSSPCHLPPSAPMQDQKQPSMSHRFINKPFKYLKKSFTTKNILTAIPDIINDFRD